MATHATDPGDRTEPPPIDPEAFADLVERMRAAQGEYTIYGFRNPALRARRERSPVRWYRPASIDRVCPECLHRPSSRGDCTCGCHAVADESPALLAFLQLCAHCLETGIPITADSLTSVKHLLSSVRSRAGQPCAGNATAGPPSGESRR